MFFNIANVTVSLCYAATISDNQAEIDVATHKEYKGQNLATIVTGEFIKNCHKSGINPSWDCFEENTPSLRLAKKLQFVEDCTYNLLSFNRKK